MLSEILQAMARELKGLANEAEVHIGELKQGFTAPSFFIRQLKHSHTHKLGKRYQRVYYFDVEYHSANDPGAELTYELAEIGEALMMKLEYLNTDSGLIRGEGFSFHTEDGVLHTFCEYPVFIQRLEEDEIPLMEELELTINPRSIEE